MDVSKYKLGVGISHYSREDKLHEIVKAVIETTPPGTRIVVADDGSKNIEEVARICSDLGVILISGKNKGVGFNKNRLLFMLQDCTFICILEDDLMPIDKGWMESYIKAAALSGIHHFCRVQPPKEVSDSMPEFSNFMIGQGLTPLFAPSPRGDLTFITKKVIQEVGAFNPEFIGVGHAHGEYVSRILKAGLIPHSGKFIDIKESRDKFIQIGDREGGRWTGNQTVVEDDLRRNRKIRRELEKSAYIYHDLVLE